MRWLRNLFTRPASEAASEAAARPATPAAAGPPATGWDSWRAHSPEGPVAVALDLALERTVPDPGRPILLRVAYPLRAPGPDGLPTAAEGEALARAEDALSRSLAAAGAAYAGRITMAGDRQHLFYLAEGTPAADAVAAAAPALAGYEVTSHGEADPAWASWSAELLPPPRTRRWMEDRRELEALARQGVPAEAARPLDHQASFPGAEAREAFAAEAAAQGFEPVARRDDAPPPTPFSVDLRRDDLLTLRHIHGVSWGLQALAARHGGSYDGWEPAGP